MKIMKWCWLISFILILGCTENYVIEEAEYERSLVVEGLVTNQAEPCKVYVSYSSKVVNPVKQPLRNCLVKIVDDLGNVEVLIEKSSGEYVTSRETFQGNVGRSYKLIIETPDGEEYESEYETMLPSVGIDSVYPIREDIPVENELIDWLTVYQFYIDTDISYQDSTYFMWDLTETYVYNTEESYFPVYVTQDIHKVFIAKTAGLSVKKITEKPLHYIDVLVDKPGHYYDLLTKQYVISKRAYEYWDVVLDMNSEQSFITYRIPYQINGNVSNINDPDEIVLGYFIVGSMTQRLDHFFYPLGEFD